MVARTTTGTTTMTMTTTTRRASTLAASLCEWGGLVASGCVRSRAWDGHRDDLIAAGFVGLLMAARSFPGGPERAGSDPDGFKNYAAVCIFNEVAREKRFIGRAGFVGIGIGSGTGIGKQPIRRPRSLDSQLRGKSHLRLSNTIVQPDRSPDPRLPHRGRDEVGRAVRSLPNPHRGVVASLYGVAPLMACDKTSPEAIARRRGWPLSRVHQVEAEALAMLRERLQDTRTNEGTDINE